MNRTVFRGVTAATMSGVALTAGVATALASAGDAAAPTPRTAERAELAPHLAIRPAPTPKPRAKPHRNVRASRSFSRPALSGSPRAIAQTLVLRRGWSEGQWQCLDALWTRESGWRVHAHNRRSGAYGIPQALPGTKMATAGADWRDNALTQIRWGLSYIARTYGTPCAALAHSNRAGYY